MRADNLSDQNLLGRNFPRPNKPGSTTGDQGLFHPFGFNHKRRDALKGAVYRPTFRVHSLSQGCSLLRKRIQRYFSYLLLKEEKYGSVPPSLVAVKSLRLSPLFPEHCCYPVLFSRCPDFILFKHTFSTNNLCS